MVDRTDNRGYVYPQCDPPLIKDRSDIRFMADLAGEIDADATSVENLIEDRLERPDAARVAFAGSIVIPAMGPPSNNLVTAPYNSVTYDNTSGGITDLANFGIRPVERGWYMVVSQVRCTTDGTLQLMTRNLRNGLSFQEGRRLEGPSEAISLTDTSMQTSDLMLIESGDLIQTQFKTNTTGTFTFELRLSLCQILRLGG